MTVLDLQLKTLRNAAIKSITQVATRMKEEATDVKATIGDIEDWLDRIKQLAEEVKTELPILCKQQLNVWVLESKIFVLKWNSNEVCCLSSPASEQHARCDYLDVERREAGGLCQSSSQSHPVH